MARCADGETNKRVKAKLATAKGKIETQEEGALF